MKVGFEKIAIFDQHLESLHVVKDATVRCCKESAARPWQVGNTYWEFMYST